MSYNEFVEASKEDEIYVLAYGKNPFQPRLKAATIRYRYLAIKQKEMDIITIDPKEEDKFE